MNLRSCLGYVSVLFSFFFYSFSSSSFLFFLFFLFFLLFFVVAKLVYSGKDNTVALGVSVLRHVKWDINI